MLSKSLFILLVIPVISAAQKPLPRFENDTLYTATGYKIYTGQSLTFGKGSGARGYYQYINVKADLSTAMLSGNDFMVRKLSDFGISQLNNTYIGMRAAFTLKNGRKGIMSLHVAIDNAIHSAELIVPEADRFTTGLPASGMFKNVPRFENDTVFTTSGHKLFAGKMLRFGNGSGKNNTFKHVYIISGATASSLSNTTIIIKDLQRFGVHEEEGAAIELLAGITFKDGSTGTINMRLAFDEALSALELIIPGEQ